MEFIMTVSETKHPKAPQYVSQLSTPVGYLHVIANDEAITAVVFSDTPKNETPNDVSQAGKAQLGEYFAQKREHFDLPLAAKGTPFQHSVWQALMKIEYGTHASYLDIAKAIGNEKACRAVGAANGKNPIAIIVPCHRIIGTNGTLTGYAGGMSRKAYLLSLESQR
jgi:methylated-DNA-[protein]-cysteine S-methyltransferase